MKVGILTFPNSTSYGASLQMYALYYVLTALDCDAEVINYHNLYMKKELHYGKSNCAINKLIKQKIRYILHNQLYRNFRQFEKNKMTEYPKNSFHDPAYLMEIGKRYDAVICGSDQVWNPDITNNDLSYFLNFCSPETKRISYAPSAGIEVFLDEYCEKIKPELERFTAISVREDACRDMIKKLLDIEVPVVIDPTLLLDRKDWTMLEKECTIPTEGYVLLYTIKRSKKLFDFALKLAESQKKKLLVIGGNLLSNLKKQNNTVKYIVDIGPEQWLYFFHHAECVVTNSFHGTAFSINYRKNFYVEFSSLTNSRLEQIVRTFGLEERIVDQQSKPQMSMIDYSLTESILPLLREKSMSFLRQALEQE